MYNRYIRNDNGSYTRIPEEDPHTQPPPPPPNRPPEPPPEGPPPPPEERPHQPGPGRPPPSPGGSGRSNDGLTGFLQHILDQLHLDHVDTGDLLLLALLFFLFREDADEELLVALGLLLIL